MEKNRSLIEQDVNTLVFYMNGGLDYNDAWLMTANQRGNMGEVIRKHHEAQNPDRKKNIISNP
jgi:hypothetical protein